MGDALDQRPCQDITQETKSMDVRKSTFLFEHLLEMLSFLSRNQLERISITSKLFNNLLRQCFAVKPYRYQHSELVIDPKENGKHLRLITTMMDDSGKESVHYLHINKSNDAFFDWKQQIRCYSVEEIRQFFPESLRIKRITFYININARANLTKNDMFDFESVSHIWKNGEMWFLAWDPNNDTEAAYISSTFSTIFSNLKLLGVRELTLRESNFNFVPELAYDSIYRNVEVLNIRNFFEDLSAPLMFNLIESKYKFADNKTCFVYHYALKVMQLGELIKSICSAFSKSLNPHSYIMAIVQMNRYVFSKLHQQIYPRGLEMDEFRLENRTTNEALQLKKITANDLDSRFNIQVTPDKYSTVFLLERLSL